MPACPRRRHDRGASIQRSNWSRGRVTPDVWPGVCSGSRGLGKLGASRKAHGGTQTAIGQAGMGDGEGARIVRVSEHQARAAWTDGGTARVFGVQERRLSGAAERSEMQLLERWAEHIKLGCWEGSKIYVPKLPHRFCN